MVDRWRYFWSVSGRSVRNFRKVETAAVGLPLDFTKMSGVTTRRGFYNGQVRVSRCQHDANNADILAKCESNEAQGSILRYEHAGSEHVLK